MNKTSREEPFLTQIIGGGPAGIGVLVAAGYAPQSNEHVSDSEKLLDGGVALIHDGPKDSIGPGGFARYLINSNSPPEDYLSGIGESFSGIGEERIYRLYRKKKKTVPLRDVAILLRALGRRAVFILQHCAEHNRVITNTRVAALRSIRGKWQSETKSGEPIALSKTAVIATGGREELNPVLRSYGCKVHLSGDVLSDPGLENLRSLIECSDSRTVAILGGSHSGFSVAWRILQELDDLVTEEGAVTIVHRSPIKLFYDTREQACADGYEFEPDDVCPQTDRVHRFGGLRGDAKSLYQQIVRNAERRVRLLCVGKDDTAIDQAFDDSPVIVQATGYKANVIPLLEKSGKRIGPLLHRNGHVYVTDDATVRTFEDEHVPGVFATGLGHGIRPTSRTGGERNFRGSLDAVNLYQDEVGKWIVRCILSHQE